ncbi:hypothetical protein DM02DRAFT_241641 [Periconia macrospinosa]|uniref:Uncharacterized protein n=1 Tax=Periconia macrospinosa TaxID=97972 RepID=A0A2V1D5B9_9PLEO|nr:hypothetical protein DM02DRAFT_241641 [Periconia macrospinosa]
MPSNPITSLIHSRIGLLGRQHIAWYSGDTVLLKKVTYFLRSWPCENVFLAIRCCLDKPSLLSTSANNQNSSAPLVDRVCTRQRCFSFS